jgi:hypothetical protein
MAFMKTIRKLSPGQPGTKKLMERYGEDLFCVRYRYDQEKKIRVKTIELIIERAPSAEARERISPSTIVSIRIDYGEVELGRQVRSAGAKWNRDQKLWEITYGDVVALGLEERIVPGAR